MKKCKFLLAIILVIGCFLNNHNFVQAVNYTEDIIGQVEKYTSTVNEVEINTCIENGEYQKAQNLIQEAKSGYQERWDYKGLVTNDMYIAYQFKEYMTGDFLSKGWRASVTTWFSGLFYNDELREYLSLQSPGKEKYKDMLKQFINDSQEELVCLEYADNLISTICSTDEFTKFLDLDTYDILYQKFSKAGSKEEINKIMMQFIDDHSDFFTNESNMYMFRNDLAKSFEILDVSLDYIETTISGIMDIQYVCANKDVLNYYNDFLNNIQKTKNENGDYIAPNDLREAAYELQKELDGNISSIIDRMINKIGFTTAETGIKVLKIVDINLLNQIALGIDIGTLVGNAVFDMGSLVKGVSYVQGYAYIGEIYSIILEKDKEIFLKDKSEKNAQQFRKDYEILYNIRIKGEEAYLDMSDFSETWEKEDRNILQWWTDYASKENFCSNNLELIKSFRFKDPKLVLVESMNEREHAKNELKKEEAICAYQKFLGESMIEWGDQSYTSDNFYFVVTDVNMDGIPELFLKVRDGIAPHAAGYEAIYYYDKQVIEGWRSDKIMTYYPESGIVLTYHYGMGDAVAFYQISQDGIAHIVGDGYYFNSSIEEAVYRWNEEEVTESVFIKCVKETIGSQRKEVTDNDWNLNTLENRLNISNLVK